MVETAKRRANPLGRLLLVLLASLVVVGGGFYVSNPLFWNRYFSIPFITVWSPPIDWYSPTEIVAGARAPAYPTVSADQAGIDAAALEAAAAYAEQKQSDALLVLRNGELVLERYWNGTDATTVFSSHSFHKSILAMLFGIAIGDGKIESLDLPVSRYLPEWEGDPRGAITIRQMLQNVSGMAPPPYDDRSPSSLQVTTFIGTDIIAASLENPLLDPPGSAFGHYNVNSMLAGAILERATGERYATYLSTRLWAPAGAADARVWLDRPDGMAHTDCCMLTETYDWLRIGEILRLDGMAGDRRVLPAGWVQEMIRSSTANPNYGLQIWVGDPYVAERPYSPLRADFTNLSSEPYRADDVFFMDGWGNKRLWVIPSAGLVILRTGTIADDWDDSRIPNLIVDGIVTYAAR